MHIHAIAATAIDFDFPEIALISLRGLISLTLIVGLMDTIFAMLAAVAQHRFDWHYVLAWLVTHGQVWLAIIGLGVLGSGIPALDVPAIHVSYLAAQAALVLYVGNTVKSMAENARDSRSPAPPPVVEPPAVTPQGNTWT